MTAEQIATALALRLGGTWNADNARCTVYGRHADASICVGWRNGAWSLCCEQGCTEIAVDDIPNERVLDVLSAALVALQSVLAMRGMAR